ncbi:hypothetical protein MHZ36_12625 [Staphylococcus sp. ACRSN]|uniref:hypothetical protein n=1 Tax=Staphylococcus sp. ACRSN TaxID=2918214 RepID=UPI001EF2ED98|nr:hypothetical protein [Staphylococcus sp. ACRSN]MCG7340133.1 hypothetical protein [Staphylococcus sp. ACRSN]
MKKVIALVIIAFLFLCACGKTYETKDIIKGFKDDDLNVNDEKKMTHDDFGAAPMKAIDARIFIVNGNNHSRLLKFKNESDLKQTKIYYDELGKESAILYSHTYSKEKYLIQMNGEVDDHTFEKYKKSMQKTLK